MKDYFLYTKCLITQQILKNRAVMRMHYAKKGNHPNCCTRKKITHRYDVHVVIVMYYLALRLVKKRLCFEIFIKLAFCFQGRMHVHIQVPVSIIIRHS